jgi:outer membrane receptor protein involved in Fe transport
MQPPSRTLRALYVLALLPSFTASLRAQAAPASGTPSTAEVVKLEAFTVTTGSNIKRLEFEKVLPVTVFDLEAIEVKNPTTPVELLQSLPQITGSSTNEFGNSPTSGRGDAASINLRGIGDGNTLILLDGLRIAPRAVIQGQALPNNVNALPTRGLERIDILRDGASSVYGADAVAGVVNYITRQNYRGTELVLRGTVPQHRGGETGEVAITNGTAFARGKGNLLSTWSYLYREPIYFRDRPFTATDDRSALAPAPWNTPTGPFNGTAAIGVWPTFRLGTATANNYFRPVNGTPALTTVAPNRLANPEFYVHNNAHWIGQPRTDRLSLYEKASYQFTSTLAGYVDYYLYRARSAALRSPMFSTNGSEGFVPMSADNPFNPYGSRFYHPAGAPNADGTPRLTGAPREIGVTDYTLPDYPAANADVMSQIYRLAGGLKGRFGQTWSWTAAAAYSGSAMRELTDRAVYIPGYRAAMLRTDNTAFNPFGYTFKVQNGAVVADQPYRNPDSVRRTMEGTFHNGGYVSVATGILNASGEILQLRGRTLSLAAGAEYRRELYRNSRHQPADPRVRTFLSAAALPDSSGSRQVFSAYAETVLPLFTPERRAPLFESLELTAAARLEDYSDFGRTTNPKYGLNWKPARWLMIRASYNEGFRAPPLPALYMGQFTANTVNATDPYRNPATLEGIYRSNNTTGSNPNLKPETSQGRTGGFVIEVPRVKGLSVSADYWQIAQRGILGSVSTGAIQNNDAALLRAETQRQLAAGTAIAQVDLGSGTAGYKGDARLTRFPVTADDRAVFAAYNAARPAAQQLAPVGRIDTTRTLTENRSEAFASGIDLGIKYDLPALRLGRVSLSSNAAYIVKSHTVTDAGGPKNSRLLRAALARWRRDATLSWRKGSWNASVAAYYVGPLLDTGAFTTAAIYESLGRPAYIAKVVDELGNVSYFNTMPSILTWNATAGYSFKGASRWFKNTRVRLSVQNLLDREPPLSSGGFSAGSQQNLLTGRAFSVEWTRTY